MGLIFDVILSSTLTNARPKPVMKRDDHISGAINIRNNFVIFGGSPASFNESKAVSALESKIVLCQDSDHPAVILTSDIEWARRILRTCPDIIAPGFNTRYEPFGMSGDRMSAKYMIDGIISSHRQTGSADDQQTANSSVSAFFDVVFGIVAANYGSITYAGVRSVTELLFNSGGLLGFQQNMQINGRTVDPDSIQTLNWIWSHGLASVRAFWNTMNIQFFPYTSRFNDSSDVHSALMNNRIVLFCLPNVNSDMLRTAVLRDISMIAAAPFPYCIIDRNVPLSNDLNAIFAPYAGNSVELGMYFTSFRQFGDLSAVSPLIDELVCLGVRNNSDAESIARQYNYMVHRWTPHISRKGGIGMGLSPTPVLDPNLLRAGRQGIPDGSAYVFNRDGYNFYHTFRFVR